MLTREEREAFESEQTTSEKALVDAVMAAAQKNYRRLYPHRHMPGDDRFARLEAHVIIWVRSGELDPGERPYSLHRDGDAVGAPVFNPRSGGK